MSVRRGLCALWCLSGCNRDLNEIEGYDLGHPTSAVWNKDDTTQLVMVVASDYDSLCSVLSSSDGSEPGSFTLWTWSTVAAVYEEDLSAKSLANLRDGVLDNDYLGDGVLLLDNVKDATREDLRVHIDLQFGSDRVKGNLEAEHCDADLFGALEGPQPQ